MGKMECVLVELTRLYDLCLKNSIDKNEPDGWKEIARAIATAEDVTIKELREEEAN